MTVLRAALGRRLLGKLGAAAGMARPMIALGVLVCAAIWSMAADAADSYAVREAGFLIHAGETPPAATLPNWERRALPDDWDRSQPDTGGNGWYRIAFEVAERGGGPWAVHVQRQRMTAAAYLNGSLLGDGGRFVEPVARNWNRPLYFLIPADLLRIGTNVLHVRVLGDPNLHAGLFALTLGPDAALRADYERRFFLKVTLNQALFVMTLAMAVLMGLFWLRRREEKVYGWFALTSALWAANSTHFFVRELPFDTRTWEWFGQTSTDWFAVLLAIVTHRYSGIQRPRLERAFLGYGILGSCVLAFVPLQHMFLAANALHVGAVAIISYVIVFAGLRAWQVRRADHIVLAAGFAAQGALGLHDWILQLGLMQHTNWYLLHYGAPVLLAVMAWLLTSRFVQTLNESQALNDELEQRVEQKRRELALSFQQQQILQRAQVVAEERERIMRDLHDGLGGQLVSALALAHRGNEHAIEQTLREALDDLRLVIDSLDPEDLDLPVLLGTVRGRLEPRMSQHGLRFEWQVKDVPTLPGFGPDKALQVLRIVQEAIANILKHAHAHTITVRTGTRSAAGDGGAAGRDVPGVYIEVIDDGVGMSAAHVAGRGLGNMRSRAARIGGRIDFDSGESGTAVRLWLPLAA